MILALVAEAGIALASPPFIRYQATVTDAAGIRLTGPHDLTFTILDAEMGGTSLWTESRSGIVIDDGNVDVLLGHAGTPLNPAVFNADDRWLELVVDGVVLVPRQRLSSVPYAHVTELHGDLTAAQMLDRAQHTGTQPPATISPQGAGSGLDADLLDGFDAADLTGTSGVDVFDVAGTFSWTAPDSIRVVFLTIVGAGGGGSGGNNGPDDGTGGGGGATVIDAPYVVVPGNSYTVIVGTGGNGGLHFGGDGEPGEASSFGMLSCPGGGGGPSVGETAGGTGGVAPTTASQSDFDGAGTQGGGVANFGEHFHPAPPIAIDGGDGGPEPPVQASGGGGTPFGLGGIGRSSGASGDPGAGFGSGGGGGGPNGDGGGGADGLVIVRY
jgi:hypothetical protein